jgi:hypothetical protein
MELANKGLYRRGKGLVVIMVHPELLFRFEQTEEEEIEGLGNICCVRGEWNNLTWVSPRSLNISEVTCALQLSISNTTSVLEYHRIVLSDAMCGIKRRRMKHSKIARLTYGTALDKEVLASTVSALINLIRNFA